MFNLFRLPLGAFSPHDLLYVFEDDGRLAGLLRVERESQRDEWTVVELDGIGQAEAGDIRFRLVQHLLRDGSKRGAVRFHVACADTDGNVELFMQAGFARYGEEIVLSRPSGPELPTPWTDEEMARAAHPAGGRARLPGARPPLHHRDAGAGPASRGAPARGLGTPGDVVARAPVVARADPPVRRRRGLRPGGRRRRQGRHGPRRHSSRSASPRRTSPTTSR